MGITRAAPPSPAIGKRPAGRTVWRADDRQKSKISLTLSPSVAVFNGKAFGQRQGSGRSGAWRRVPAATAERPLSVQSRDLRGDVRQRARRAVSGPWQGFATVATGVKPGA